MNTAVAQFEAICGKQSQTDAATERNLPTEVQKDRLTRQMDPTSSSYVAEQHLRAIGTRNAQCQQFQEDETSYVLNGCLQKLPRAGSQLSRHTGQLKRKARFTFACGHFFQRVLTKKSIKEINPTGQSQPIGRQCLTRYCHPCCVQSTTAVFPNLPTKLQL